MKKVWGSLIIGLIVLVGNTNAQSNNAKLSFTVSVKNAAAHVFHIQFRCEGIKKESIKFKLSAWTPGYYQLMHYADNVSGFSIPSG